MKFNMVCIKFDQTIKKPKKPKFWTYQVFFKPEKAIFQPCSALNVS